MYDSELAELNKLYDDRVDEVESMGKRVAELEALLQDCKGHGNKLDRRIYEALGESLGKPMPKTFVSIDEFTKIQREHAEIKLENKGER
jgi:hypothetical protein